MKLSHPIEKRGIFWLPENPEKQFWGSLGISKNGEIILEMNYLSDDSDHKITGNERMNSDEMSNLIISGIIDQESVTLYRSKMTERNHEVIHGVSNIIIHIDFALFGFDYKNNEEIMLSSMQLSVEGLREWLFISGISTQHDYESKNYTINSKPLSSISIGKHKNFDLRITFGRNFNRTRFDVSITQEAYFCLTSNKLRPLDDFLDMIHKVRSFLCLAIDRIISIKSITSYSIAKLMKIQNDEIHRPIKTYYRSFPFSTEVISIHRYGMLFSYSDIHDKLDHAIKKWIESYDLIEPVFRLYFASSAMFDRYSPERFLLLVRAVEVFHRRNFDGQRFSDEEFKKVVDNILSNVSEEPELHSFFSHKMQYANEISLSKRIKQIILPFENLFGSKRQMKSFLRNVTDTRNYLTHYNPNLEDRAVTKGRDIYKLCVKLEALIQLHFLKLMGMDVESIENIARKNNHFRHKLGLD